MTQNQLKQILDSLVLKEDRGFTVKIMPRPARFKKRGGTIFYKRHEITVYTTSPTRDIDQICAGIHELAHYVNYKTFGKQWERFKRTFHKPIPYHGNEFKHTLAMIVLLWNRIYGSMWHGKIVFDKKRPTVRPRFERAPQ